MTAPAPRNHPAEDAGGPDAPDLELVDAWLDDDSAMPVPDTQWGLDLAWSIRELVRRERNLR